MIIYSDIIRFDDINILIIYDQIQMKYESLIEIFNIYAYAYFDY